MNEYIIYVFAKDAKIKVLTHEQALEESHKLIAQGYTHTATISPTSFLEHLHNHCEIEDIKDQIKILSNPTF